MTGMSCRHQYNVCNPDVFLFSRHLVDPYQDPSSRAICRTCQETQCSRHLFHWQVALDCLTPDPCCHHCWKPPSSSCEQLPLTWPTCVLLLLQLPPLGNCHRPVSIQAVIIPSGVNIIPPSLVMADRHIARNTIYSLQQYRVKTRVSGAAV